MTEVKEWLRSEIKKHKKSMKYCESPNWPHHGNGQAEDDYWRTVTTKKWLETFLSQIKQDEIKSKVKTVNPKELK